MFFYFEEKKGATLIIKKDASNIYKSTVPIFIPRLFTMATMTLSTGFTLLKIGSLAI